MLFWVSKVCLNYPLFLRYLAEPISWNACKVLVLFLTLCLSGLQDSEDIRLMVGALKDLGIKLEEDWSNDKITVHGCAGKFPVENAQLYLGNAGTAMR